jgi:PKD repeat protein
MSHRRLALRVHRSFGFVVSLALFLLLTAGGCLSPNGNRPPIVSFSALPEEGYAPLAVLLDGSATADPDGHDIVYEWTFGDGSSATGRTVTHIFPVGTFDVTLRATDTQGGVGTASISVTVRAIPDGFVVQRYEWTHDGQPQVWQALLPYNLVQTYRARIRTSYADRYDYPAYVLDPLDDPTLEDLAGELWDRAAGVAGDFVQLCLSFVQDAIDYVVDPLGAEWPLYPLETLFDRAGDCEDTAILFVSLLRAKGLDSRLATVDTDGDSFPDHVLALVPVSANEASGLICAGDGSLTVLEIDDALFAVAETACLAGTLGLGCDPWGLDASDVIESWDF